jgi:hypothetical protein
VVIMADDTPEMPADIAAAIDALEIAAEQLGGQTWLSPGDGAPVINARAALNAAILGRLAAAEAARGEALRERDEGLIREEVLQGASSDAEYWSERALAAEAARDAALARAERLEAENAKLREATRTLSEDAVRAMNATSVVVPARPMTGLWATLTPEQRRRVLEIGDDI